MIGRGHTSVMDTPMLPHDYKIYNKSYTSDFYLHFHDWRYEPRILEYLHYSILTVHLRI